MNEKGQKKFLMEKIQSILKDFLEKYGLVLSLNQFHKVVEGSKKLLHFGEANGKMSKTSFIL